MRRFPESPDRLLRYESPTEKLANQYALAHQLLPPSDRRNWPEKRWRTIGFVGSQVLMIVHNWPEVDTETGEEVGRIISARKATSRERQAYEEEHH